MTFATFAPALQPSLGSGYQTKTRMISNSFGDGYDQTVPDGLNAARLIYSAKWNSLLVSQADAIEAFFQQNMGKPFWWQPVRLPAPIKWMVSDWSRAPVSGLTDTISASFTQRFDLGT